jgi:hypothetical protein
LLRRAWCNNGSYTTLLKADVMMAGVLGGRQTVPVEDVVLAKAFQLEALLNVLEQKGMIGKAEVLEEIKRLRAKLATTRQQHHERRGDPDARGRTQIAR